MPYKLIISKPPETNKVPTSGEKGVGYNIFLDNLPLDYQVYLFYYPGGNRNIVLEEKLISFGETTGKNMLVNIGIMNDNNFEKIVELFEIESYPVIILTAIDKYASPKKEFLTAYVKIDGKDLFNNPDLMLECIQTLFNLFLRGKIFNAMYEAKIYEEKAFILKIMNVVSSSSKSILSFITKRDIIIDFIKVRLELKIKEK